MSSPYPLLRPRYYKGYSREQDEKLAKKLFYGTTVRDEKTGHGCHQYLPEGSPQECQGFEALCRLLSLSCKDLEPTILAALLCSLGFGGGFQRRLVFKRKKGKQPDPAADSDIALCVGSLCQVEWKTEAAVRYAMKEFGLSRKAVFEARKRSFKF